MNDLQDIQWEAERHPPGSLIVFEVSDDMERALRSGTVFITEDRRWFFFGQVPIFQVPDSIHGTPA